LDVGEQVGKVRSSETSDWIPTLGSNESKLAAATLGTFIVSWNYFMSASIHREGDCFEKIEILNIVVSL